MSQAAQAPQERYRQRVAPHPGQDMCGFWLRHAQEEGEMAQRLVAAGFEAPSRIHAEAATECMLRAIACFDLRAEDPGAKAAKLRKLTAALEEHRRQAGPRAALSESLLR